LKASEKWAKNTAKGLCDVLAPEGKESACMKRIEPKLMEKKEKWEKKWEKGMAGFLGVPPRSSRKK